MEQSFYQRVYEVIARIPAGKVATYGQIARYLGMPNGARAVGWAMRHCPDNLPWHRVVNAQGKLVKGEHTDWCVMQYDMLGAEGVQIGLDGCVDLKVYGWDMI